MWFFSKLIFFMSLFLSVKYLYPCPVFLNSDSRECHQIHPPSSEFTCNRGRLCRQILPASSWLRQKLLSHGLRGSGSVGDLIQELFFPEAVPCSPEPCGEPRSAGSHRGVRCACEPAPWHRASVYGGLPQEHRSWALIAFTTSTSYIFKDHFGV